MEIKNQGRQIRIEFLGAQGAIRQHFAALNEQILTRQHHQQPI
jgi:hypothetical protein